MLIPKSNTVTPHSGTVFSHSCKKYPERSYSKQTLGINVQLHQGSLVFELLLFIVCPLSLIRLARFTDKIKEVETMGLFTKYCAFCGMKIEKDQDIIRFGKHFDSEQHAELYAKQQEENHKAHDESAHQGHGCCC